MCTFLVLSFVIFPENKFLQLRLLSKEIEYFLWFIYAFTKYLLNTYYAPETVPCPENTKMKELVSPIMGFTD